MSKEQISRNYIVNTLNAHRDKIVPEVRKVIITGTQRPGSIGGQIYYDLYNLSAFEPTVWNEDVRQASNVFHSFENTVFELGIDTLIMCHGLCHMDWLENAPDEKMSEVIEVNLTGSIRLVQAFVRSTLGGNKRKKIVSIGSMAYNHVLNGSAAYCASKAGLAHFMKCAAFELAPKGFDVYSIHPSNVADTPMTRDTIEGLARYRNLDPTSALQYWGSGMIREKMLTKKDIVETVINCLNDNGFMSGCNIELNGGNR